MADTLASLEIEVKHKASGAESEIGKVTEAIRAMSRALGTALPQLKEYAETLKNIGGKVKGSIPKGATGKAMSPYWQDKIRNASDRDVALAKQKFAEQDRELALQETGDERGAWKAQERYMRAARQAAKASKESAKGIDTVAKSASKAKGPLEHLIASFKRIMLYRILRNIIKSIGDAAKEGLQNAYQFSAGITSEGHRFAAALDSMKSAGLTMKNQIGSAFIGLLAAIAPVVNAIIGLVTRLANALSQIFAIFTGGTYLKAADVPAKWADAAGGAAKSAKEWRNQLLGFDEINRLDKPDDGSGGGGGGSAIDPSQMFVDTPIDGIFAKIREKFLEFRDSLDFQPIIDAWGRLKDAVSGLAETIGQAIGWLWDNVLAPFIAWMIESLIPVVMDIVANVIRIADAILERLGPVFDWLWKNILAPIAAFIGDTLIKVLQELSDLLGDIADLISGKISFKEFIGQLDDLQIVTGIVCTALGVGGLIGLLNTLKDTVLIGVFLAVGKVSTALSFLAANPVVLVIAGIVALVAAVALLIKHWDEVSAAVQNFQQKLGDALGNGKLEWLDFAAVAAHAIMAPIDAIINLIQWIIELCNWISTALEGLSIVKSANARANQIQADGSIYLQGFASGGFPSEGQLFIANEAGPEMVGTIGGRNAVAPNNDIVEGIRQGVFEAVSAAMNNGNQNVNVKVYLDSREIKAGQNRLTRAMGV